MKYLIPVTLIFFFISCGKKSEKPKAIESIKDEIPLDMDREISIDSLRSQVLAIHDEVMPEMGALRKTRKELLSVADSLRKRAAMLSAVADEIGNANESMMQWMRAYEPEFEGTDEEIKQYLEDQKVAIQKVKDDMNGSLQKGKEVLEKEN